MICERKEKQREREQRLSFDAEGETVRQEASASWACALEKIRYPAISHDLRDSKGACSC